MYSFFQRFAIFFIIPLNLFAQGGDYSDPENAHYWKWNKPSESYWQQDVNYHINAEIIPENSVINGRMKVVYTNNSPQRLTEIYFHLYQNAFQPGSYFDKLSKANKISNSFGPNESQGKGTSVSNISLNGLPVKATLDNTILRIDLPYPLLPNQSAELTMEFQTWFDQGSMRRRMNMYPVPIRNSEGNIYQAFHINGVHWYPRIAVFDRKFNWHIDQHLGKEFYGEFGSFEVNLTLPGNYILDATGVLQNEDQVLPKKLKESISIENFQNKPFGEIATEILPASAPQKNWKFKALNVHDFAFTADPTYRRGEVIWNGISAIALAQEAHAARWQDAAQYAADVIETYSIDFGQYIWPKIIVADANDGMEYPMLTLDGGTSPTYKGLLAHEIGHQWFYGMVGSNETYRAFMDEGLTQYLTSWALKKLVGDTIFRKGMEVNTFMGRNYFNYLQEALRGYDGFLNTHSHHFHGSMRHENGYVQVYYKTATMLKNLEYLLGKEVFQDAMRHYFQKWKMCHPYPEDFREAITESAQTDLTWFFDQWLETDKKLDYAITHVKKTEKGRKVRIDFKRKERMIMPLEFEITTVDDQKINYLIPVSPYKKPKEGIIILPEWLGFDKLNQTYSATLELPAAYKMVRIDPSNRLGDIYMLDNFKGSSKLKIEPRLVPAPNRYYPEREKYHLKLRPNIWYNGQSGIQAGISFQGDYFGELGKTYFGAWISNGWANSPLIHQSDSIVKENSHRLSYSYRYATPLRKLGRNIHLDLQSAFRDGLHNHGITLRKRWAVGQRDNPYFKEISFGYKLLNRPRDGFRDYLLFPDRWSGTGMNTQFWTRFTKGYRILKGTGQLDLEMRNASLGSTTNWATLSLESRYNLNLKKLLLKYRLFAQYGTGTIPLESTLYLAEGNPEEMMEDEFYRARGFIPNDWMDNDLGRSTATSHFGGGLNLRGYAGYFAEFSDRSPEWYGNHGIGMNLELEFQKLINWSPAKINEWFTFHSYLFADGGAIGQALQQQGFDGIRMGQFRMDAGLGLALDIHDKWFFQEKPLTIRFDFPFFLNRPPATEEFLAGRWRFGIGRAF